MGLTTVTPPASDPVSLVEAKAHLRVDHEDDDGIIAGYIVAAREYIENDTHLRLVTQTLDYTIDDGWPCIQARGYFRTRIELPVKPVASVTSISYVDGNGTTQVLASNQYTLSKDGPVCFIEPAYNVTWPDVRCQTAAITVRFVAGTAASEVPNQLCQGIRWLLAHQYEHRESVTDRTFSEVPSTLESFISGYRFSRF